MKFDYKEVLNFWFNEIEPKKWYLKDHHFDNEIKRRFEEYYNSAKSDKLNLWENEPQCCLALIIILDQFPRNMYRNTPVAFESDKLALRVTYRMINKDLDKHLESNMRRFVYMPLMHSEELIDQRRCVEIFTKLSKGNSTYENNLKYAKDHKKIIEKFGRFPHRNEILGRESTKEELEFLKTHKGY